MKKSFGQHFLTDKKYLQKIISSLCLQATNSVLEIGAGSGILTCELAGLFKKVYAIEVERVAINKLKKNIESHKYKNVDIVNKSFLKLDLSSMIPGKFSIIGNIPYNISSKIIAKIFGEIGSPAEHFGKVEDIYLMLQYEVAQRLVAKPSCKAYSPLTLFVQYFSEPEILFAVPKEAFTPPPKIRSAFIRLKPKKKLIDLQTPLNVRKVINTSFQQRRKKVLNPLSRLIAKDKLIAFMRKNAINENVRAENLTFDDYVDIAQVISSNE